VTAVVEPVPSDPPAIDAEPALAEVVELMPGLEELDVFDNAGPLVPEDAAPLVRPAVTPTIEQFESIWPPLFAGLRDMLGSRRWALFRETEPGAVEGSTLVVAVKHDFHLKALKDDNAVAKIVATRAGDLLGGDVRVVFRGPGETGGSPSLIADTDQVEDDLSSVEFEPDRLVDTPPATTDPFTLVTEELGGLVVDEYEVEDD
jgi:hypothetical protein